VATAAKRVRHVATGPQVAIVAATVEDVLHAVVDVAVPEDAAAQAVEAAGVVDLAAVAEAGEGIRS
jgi:hypothetical protein